MARSLADVIHHFLPELGPEDSRPPPTAAPPAVWLPVASNDVVRAALAWNLAVELSRSGARTAVVAPAALWSGSPWPPPGPGPLGVELVAAPVNDAAALAGEAAKQAAAGPRLPGAPSPVAPFLVCCPPDWLSVAHLGDSVPWLLVLARAEEAELRTARDQLLAAGHAAPGARLGVSVFGVRRVAEAREAFEQLAAVVTQELQRPLWSYGLLVEDLDLCRSIVAQRPLALSRPRSPAARALADVARLLRDDAQGSGP